MSAVWQIAAILFFTVVNGVLAMSEIAIVSARRFRLRQAAEAGNEQARDALALADEPTQFLATVQIGITLVGILAGAFGEATLARSIASSLSQIAVLSPYAGAVATLIVVAGVTYISLVIGELAPKRLALNNAEKIASAVAGPMKKLSVAARPAVWFLTLSTNAVVQLLGIKPSDAPDITMEEIEGLVEHGTDIGVFEDSEREMVASVLRLDDRRVDAFMTPRTQVTWLDLEDPEDHTRGILLEAQHSRFPVMVGSPDNAVGILYARDMLVRYLRDEPFDIRACLRPILFVPESMSTLRLLETFQRQGVHVALVTDEYGSVQGMITDMDILEAIAGDIPAEGEPEEPRAIQRADGTWLVDGLLHINRLWAVLDLADEMADDYRGYQTVSGFVMSELEGIPSEGEWFELLGQRFEIVDMDGHRIDKVLVTPGPQGTERPQGDARTSNGL